MSPPATINQAHTNGGTQPPKTRKSHRAQRNRQYPIVYDFGMDTIHPDEEYWVKEKSKVTYCIDNINVLLYDITINKEKADYTDEATLPGNNTDLKNNLKSFSSDFQSFLSQTRENIGTITTTEIIKKLKKENEEEIRKASLQADVAIGAVSRLRDTTRIKNAIAEFEAKKRGLSANVAANKDAISRAQSSIDSLNNTQRKLIEQVAEEKAALLKRMLNSSDPQSITVKIDDKLKQIDSNFYTYQKIIVYYENLYTILYQDLSEGAVSYQKLIKDRKYVTETYFPLDSSQIKGGKSMLSQMVDVIYATKIKLIKHTSDLLALSGELQNSIDAYVREHSTRNGKAGISTAAITEITVSKLKLANLSQLLTSITNYNKIDELNNEIQILYKAFDKYTFKVCEKEFDMSGIDNLKFSTVIKPVPGLKNIKPMRKESFDFNINTYQGIKFDISVGAYFNFGLNDHSYFYEHTIAKDTLGAVISDLVNIRKKNDPNQYIPFVGTQLNVYWRLAPAHWGTGFNLGLSTNASDVRMYLGAIQVLGKKERIVLSGGVVGGRIETLSGQYQENVSYDYTAANFPSSPEMVHSYKIGWYVSFTFNLLNRKGRSLFGPKDGSDK